MHYHIVLTQRCNLHCTYCGNSIEPSLMPVNTDYDTQDLLQFLTKDKTPAVIAFYGGEPLLNKQRLMEIMDTVPAKAFMIQTNGTLLHTLPSDYIKRFHSILVSIDGTPEKTDAFRGKGTYDRAIRGAQYARENGFTGDLIARMTVTQGTDIYREVMHLLTREHPSFDHVHWQLDAMWDIAPEQKWKEFEQWAEQSYNPGITRLINHWTQHAQETHDLLGIAPFLGIMHTLLTNTKVKLRCGAGIDFFSITTDGRVTFCPIPPSFELATIGNIYQNKPEDLIEKVTISGPCLTCEVKDVCGGRCLYTNKTMHWGINGFNAVCKTVKHLIHELQRVQPVFQDLIDSKAISINDVKYPKIQNGVEIIP